MPKPTLENSKFFKELLKKYRAKFNSQIQTCKLSDLEAIWSTANRHSTYPTGDPDIKVVMMEGGQNTTPIDISAEVTNQQLVYFPATYGDHCVVKIGESYHELKFPYDDGPVQFGGNSQTETNTWQNIGLGSTITFRSRYSNGRGFSSSTGTVKAYGGALIDFGNGITAEITAPTVETTVNEGASIDFTINVTGFTGNSSQYFNVRWVGHPNMEFNSTGDFTSTPPTYWYWYSSGSVTKTITLSEDFTSTEGAEWFQMQLVDPLDNDIVLAESPRINISDTSSGTFALSVAAAENVTRNITVQNVSGLNYYFVDGVQSPTLTFEKGKTYIFDQSDATNLNHPLRFKDGSGNPYSVGVTTSGIQPGNSGANTTIGISSGITTSALRYYCTVHGDGMGNTISVGSATSSREGQPITFIVNTTGIPSTNLYYRLEGTADTNTDFGGLSVRTGYITINTDPSSGIGTGAVTVTPVQDFTAESGESLYFELYNGQYTTSTLLATSTTIIVNDLPYTISISADKTSVQESTSGVTNSVTFTLSTTGVPDGTPVRCYIDAVGTNSTFKRGDVYKDGNTNDQFGDNYNNYYDVTINNNTATLKVNIVRDGKTEGNEQFKITVKGTTSGTTGITLATSPTITIVDSSIVGLNKTGKTFGPIRVNRDGGNASNVSDWYTICNLDKIPNNSKVALFIDTSGSMTMSTIQASYDLLVSKLNARGITFITVQNSQEDWISDFDTPL